MNIQSTHNVSFGTNVTKAAKKELKQNYGTIKANRIIRELEKDGFDDFTMKNKGIVTAYHPSYKSMTIHIPDSIYKKATSQEISQAITDTAIDVYSRVTGEYPIKNN